MNSRQIKVKKLPLKKLAMKKEKKKRKFELPWEKEAEIKRLAEEAKRAEIFKTDSEKVSGPKMVGKIDLAPKQQMKVEEAPKEVVKEEPKKDEVIKGSVKLQGLKQVGKIEIEKKKKPAPKKKEEEAVAVQEEVIPEKVGAKEKVRSKEKAAEEEVLPEETETLKTEYQKLSGPKKTGETIDLSKFARPKKKVVEPVKKVTKDDPSKKKRKRIHVQRTNFGQAGKPGVGNKSGGGRGPVTKRKTIVKEEPSPEDVQKQV